MSKPKLDDHEHQIIYAKLQEHDRRLINLEANMRWVIRLLLIILATLLGTAITVL